MTAVPLVHYRSLEAFPGLIHGISTRQGGVSRGPYASLNLGWTVGDEAAHVEANYRRLAGALGLRREHLTTTWQVHGHRILRANAADRGRMIDKADGIITDVPELPLTQRYADCTPLLVYDPRHHAAGLAHAGWRGTVAGVATALVRAMEEAFGSNPADLVAVVGPAIGPCCYEVGPEVVEAVRGSFLPAWPVLSLPKSNGETAADADKPVSGQGNGQIHGHLHFDLWEANRRQLAAAGVGQVEVAQVCTRCQRDIYFSHRGERGLTGRFAAVVMLRH